MCPRPGFRPSADLFQRQDRSSQSSFAPQVADGAAPRESLAGAYERAVTAATPRAASNADLVGEMQPTYNSLKMQLLPG